MALSIKGSNQSDTGSRTANAISLPASGAGGSIVGSDAFVTGWALRESTGVGSATVKIIDGNDANGQEIATITLLGGQSVRDTTGAIPLYFEIGVFVQVLIGSVLGTIWLVDV